MSGRSRRFGAVVSRELRTLRRSPAVWTAAVAFATLVVGTGTVGTPGGYVPLVVALLAPVELGVPALAVAAAYRSILDDRASGELSVVQTYPVDRWTYVLGVAVGRLSVVLAVVAASLLVAGATVPLAGSESTFLATHPGLDSPALYLRFVALSAAFAAVVTTVVVGVSAAATTARRALAAALGVVAVGAVGVDAAVVAGLGAGVLPPEAVGVALALGPDGAYRGLVVAAAIDPVATAPVGVAPPVSAAASLLCWTVGAVLLGVSRVWEGG